MKKCISASSALLATAMMVTLSFGCGEGVEGETGSQSAEVRNELSKGQCNAIVARGLRSAQRCYRGICGGDECTDVEDVFTEFFFTNPECGDALNAGNLNGLPGNASQDPDTGEAKHMGEVICSAVVQCGFCAATVPRGVCVDPCEVAEE